MAYVVVAVVAVTVAVFAMQNPTPVSVRFLHWHIDELPLAAMLLIALGAGGVLVGLPLWLSRWRLRSRVRGLEARLRTTPDRTDTDAA